MVYNRLFLSLAHQKTAEVLEKTFICTRCVEGFKESQGLFESVKYRNFIKSLFFSTGTLDHIWSNHGSHLFYKDEFEISTRKRLAKQLSEKIEEIHVMMRSSRKCEEDQM